MGKRMCTINGVDFTQWWVDMQGLKSSGPGQVGQAQLTFEKDGGGLTILNKSLVKIWQAHDDLGNGVADRGRYLIGIVDGKLTQSISNVKRWNIRVTDCNILLKVLQVDAEDSEAIVIAPGTFKSQVAAAVEAVQERGLGSVHTAIDAINYVSFDVPGMPAYVAKGKTLGQILLELCQNARIIEPGIRPQFYIGVQIGTYGPGESIGGPVLHMFDGALTPGSSFTFSDAPVGAERWRMETTPTRKLESQNLFSRGQLVWGPDQEVVTYEEAAAQALYPNIFQNHGGAGGTGHWTAPLEKDTRAQDGVTALALLTQDIKGTAYPREIYEHGADVVILPGEVVTEIDSLEDGLGAPGVAYRVVGSSIDVTSEPVTEPFCKITLGARRLELLEKGEGILAAPVEGDNTPPLAPTIFQLDTINWDPLRDEWALWFTWANSASRDVVSHLFHNALGDGPFERGLTGEFILWLPPSTPYDVWVTAVDTLGNVSAPSDHVTDTTPARPALEPADNLTVASNVYNPSTGLTEIEYTWSASSDPSVIGYRLQAIEGVNVRSQLVGLVTAIIVSVIPGSIIQDARIYAYNYVQESVAEPSEAGLPNFVANGPTFNTELKNPGFDIPDPNDPGQPASWVEGTSGAGQASRDTTITHTGPASAKLDPGGTGGGGGSAWYTSELIAVEPGNDYRLAAWVYITQQLGTSDNLMLYLIMYDEDFNVTNAINGPIALTVSPEDTWVLMQASPDGLAVQPGDRYVQVVVGNNGNDPDAIIYVDQVELVQLLEAPIYLAPGGPGLGTYKLPSLTLDNRGLIESLLEHAGAAWPAAAGWFSANGKLPFYNTTLGEWGVSDGTRWLAMGQDAHGLAQYRGAQPFTATEEVLAWVPHPDFATYLTRWAVGYYTGGGVDASNYWDIKIRRLTSGVSVDTLATIRTTDNNWHKLSEVPGDFTSNILNASDIWAQIYVEKVGTPNPLYLQAGVWGKLVLG